MTDRTSFAICTFVLLIAARRELSPAGQQQVATALRLFHKMKEQGRQPSRNWPQQVQRPAHRFMAKQPIAEHLLRASNTLLSLPEQAPLFVTNPKRFSRKLSLQVAGRMSPRDELLVDMATSAKWCRRSPFCPSGGKAPHRS
ncbi:MAG: hypothetical protein U0894_01700 [Pirellulales bacterium]